MIAATSTPNSTPTPSLEAVARQLGVDMASEPHLMHILSEMQTTPLPPTWTVRESATTQAGGSCSSQSTPADDVNDLNDLRLEYVNRITGETTARHPGTAYFLGLVKSERKRHGYGVNGSRFSTGSPVSSRQAHGSTFCSNSTVNDTLEIGAASHSNTSSEMSAHREKPENTGAARMAEDAAGSPTHGSAATKRGKGFKRRMPLPRWLVFTSWWHETIRGTENTMHRKHASLRYETATGSFEVELEGVPAVFQASHATGRHGKVGIIDVRVGAQISILGRQMRLMQCDGLTAQWLESEVRAITKAKAALISALEKGGDGVRVRCRSDRVEASASVQRGGDSVGHAASMDRRSLLQDVFVLRDMLAETQPEEALRLCEGLG